MNAVVQRWWVEQSPDVRRIAAVVLLLAGAAVPQIAIAADWTPNRPLRFILTFPPGGGTDLLGRMIAPHISSGLGETVLVDNRGGAGGIIGTEQIVRAQPDGYTFGLISLTAHAANASLAAKLPYDSIKDLQPLTFIGVSPQVIAVHPSSPAQSLQDLLSRGRGEGRALNYATGGIGLGSHITAEMLKIQAKTSLNHVPFKGGGPALAAGIGGQVDAVFVPLATALPAAQSGRIRVLAVAGEKRSAQLPHVPTVIEAGFPGFVMYESWGLVLPAGTPAAAAKRLHAEASKALSIPSIVSALSAQGVDIAPSTPEQLRAFIITEIRKYRDVIQSAGIKAE